MRKAPKGCVLHAIDEHINRIIAVVGCPFQMTKRQFTHMKARYRDFAKNRAQIFSLLELGKLFLSRRRLAT